MIKVDLFEMGLLPKRFVVLLESNKNETQLFLAEKKDKDLVLFDENNKRKIVTIDNIKERWSSIVRCLQ